jgi:hypothetical protein
MYTHIRVRRGGGLPFSPQTWATGMAGEGTGGPKGLDNDAALNTADATT